MWRFYIITGIFMAVAAVIILIPVSGLARFYALGIDLLLYIAVVAAGSSRISSRLFLTAICRGDKARRQVAITFDDGPHPEKSVEILEILERSGARASFFLTGRKVKGNESIVRKMVAAGHTIGNHTFSHSTLFPFFSARSIAAELDSTNQLLESITGQRVRYFRPPFGVTNPNIARGMRGMNMKAVGWSIRSFDTRNENAERVLKRISGRLTAGDIILLHETSEHILQILDSLLRILESKGLATVSLDVMFDSEKK